MAFWDFFKNLFVPKTDVLHVLSAYGEDLRVNVTADKGYATYVEKNIEGSFETSVPVPKLGKVGMKAAGSSGTKTQIQWEKVDSNINFTRVQPMSRAEFHIDPVVYITIITRGGTVPWLSHKYHLRKHGMNLIFINSRGNLLIPTGPDPGTKQDQDDLWEFIQHTRPDLYKNKQEFLNVVLGR